MKKLTDVYIKVTKANVEELMKQINRYDLEPNFYIYFISENIKCNCASIVEPKSLKKVSLTELKRLINTIPTREEIKRLKQQISGYKTNYDKVVKHSLSKEDVIEDLQRKLNRERSTITDLFKQRKEVQLNHCKQIRTLSEEVKRFKNLYDDALKVNERCKELQSDNERLIQQNKALIKSETNNLFNFVTESNRQFKEIQALKQENKQLKQRKFWQIWK